MQTSADPPHSPPALFSTSVRAACAEVPVTAIKLQVKVVPGSSRDGIAGWLGDTLKVRVTAPAEQGKANAAVEALIAEALGVPRDCARVVTGKTSPRKGVEIVGISEAEVRSRLEMAIDGHPESPR